MHKLPPLTICRSSIPVKNRVFYFDRLCIGRKEVKLEKFVIKKEVAVYGQKLNAFINSTKA